MVTSVINARPNSVSFYLEPWGDVYEMTPGAKFTLVATGPPGGDLEVEVADEGITVWGWPGSVVKVFCGDSELGAGPEGRSPVPQVPCRDVLAPQA